MPSLVNRVSIPRLSLGVGVGLVAVGLAWLEYYRPTLPVAIAVGVLSLVVAVRGLQPFGETIAYRLLLAAGFLLWGLTSVLGSDVPFIAVIFGFIGALGLVGYTWQAWHYGIWTTVEELSDAERRVSPSLDRILDFLFTYLP